MLRCSETRPLAPSAAQVLSLRLYGVDTDQTGRRQPEDRLLLSELTFDMSREAGGQDIRHQKRQLHAVGGGKSGDESKRGGVGQMTVSVTAAEAMRWLRAAAVSGEAGDAPTQTGARRGYQGQQLGSVLA